MNISLHITSKLWQAIYVYGTKKFLLMKYGDLNYSMYILMILGYKYSVFIGTVIHILTHSFTTFFNQPFSCFISSFAWTRWWFSRRRFSRSCFPTCWICFISNRITTSSTANWCVAICNWSCLGYISIRRRLKIKCIFIIIKLQVIILCKLHLRWATEQKLILQDNLYI